MWRGGCGRFLLRLAATKFAVGGVGDEGYREGQRRCVMRAAARHTVSRSADNTADNTALPSARPGPLPPTHPLGATGACACVLVARAGRDSLAGQFRTLCTDHLLPFSGSHESTGAARWEVLRPSSHAVSEIRTAVEQPAGLSLLTS
jgi:hypothetical protein